MGTVASKEANLQEDGEVQDIYDDPVPSQKELRMEWPNFRI